MLLPYKIKKLNHKKFSVFVGKVYMYARTFWSQTKQKKKVLPIWREKGLIQVSFTDPLGQKLLKLKHVKIFLIEEKRPKDI